MPPAPPGRCTRQWLDGRPGALEMLHRWLQRHDRPSRLSACSTVVVSAERSATGYPLIGLNVDDPSAVVDASISSPKVRTTAHSLGEWLTARHVFVNRNSTGLVACVIVPVQARDDEACRLGRILLACCKRVADAGRSLPSLAHANADVMVGDKTEVAVWRLRRRSIELLPATDGLLTLSAGHSSAAPLPGGGWLIGRLEHLHHRRRVSSTDVEQALCDARLGDATACTMLIDPVAGFARLIANREAVDIPYRIPA